MYRDVLEADIEDVKVYFFHNHYCCVQDVIADSKTTGERNESNKLIARQGRRMIATSWS